MEDKTVLIVQARLTSIRFPNKILKKIGSQTLLEILLKRAKSNRIEKDLKYFIAISLRSL